MVRYNIPTHFKLNYHMFHSILGCFVVQKIVTKKHNKIRNPRPSPLIQEIFLNFTNFFDAFPNDFNRPKLSAFVNDLCGKGKR